MSASLSDEPSLRRAELCLNTEYLPASCDVGKALVKIWQDVLDIDQVGINDDFFEVGGDSLAATIIASNIESRFGCRFSPSQMVEANTIRGQLDVIRNSQEGTHTEQDELYLPSHMILFNGKGTKPFLFLVHGGRGMSLHDRNFLEGLDPDQPVIFIDAIGFDGKEKTPDTIEKTAARYLEGVIEIAPDGPLLLAAPCSGSLVVMEMARQLEQAGRPANRVILIDPQAKWFRDPLDDGIKGWRKMLSRKTTTRARYFLRRLRLKLGMGHVEEFEKSLKQKATDMKAIQGRINKGRDGAAGDDAANKIEFQSDAILKTQEMYYRAVCEYRPKPWSGDAHIMITKPRESEIPAIKRILPNAKFRVTEFAHTQLFREGHQDILNFIKDVQYHKDEVGKFS